MNQNISLKSMRNFDTHSIDSRVKFRKLHINPLTDTARQSTNYRTDSIDKIMKNVATRKVG